MNTPGVINMQAARKAVRIERLIDRLGRRGAELMDRAIKNCGGPRFEDYVAGIQIITKRCRNLAAYINGLSGPKRRSA